MSYIYLCMVIIIVIYDVKYRFASTQKRLKNRVSAVIDTTVIVARHVADASSLDIHTWLIRRKTEQII
ncbi:hypothetical protein [Candidatus Enterovibrio escicola]|nr:hypothetical protein [Candidatus Enterovibrio escacola]